jgi:hypothetical protein
MIKEDINIIMETMMQTTNCFDNHKLSIITGFPADSSQIYKLKSIYLSWLDEIRKTSI